MELITNK